MGVGATNVLDRVAASIGELQEAIPLFKDGIDLPYGGVLLALPALLANGLLRGIKDFFKLPKGFYGLESIFLLLGFLALARIKNPEALRYCSPGEWGKLLGLDRIPEVKTLRAKIEYLSQKKDEIYTWGAELSRNWMLEDNPEGVDSLFYVDGHVRVYFGSQTKLPRHYVSRTKLKLRATVDYWVNGLGGNPFFLINKAVDPGLLKALEEEIVPHLEENNLKVVSEEELLKNPYHHHFILIFDREGWSPEFMKRMKTKRIACLTYRKYQEKNWPLEEFQKHTIITFSGNIIDVHLAERGTLLKNGLWAREVRRLGGDKEHQTSIITTDYTSELSVVAAQMAERWSQENFFKYMKEHYNIDRLVHYSVDAIPETTQVINPLYRELEGKVRSLTSKYSRKCAEFGSLHLEEEIDPKKIEKFEQKKAKLQEESEVLKEKLNLLKEERKKIKKHIPIESLSEDEKFKQLSAPRKHFIDTVKMIAYRAETAMVNIIRFSMFNKKDDARSLLRALYKTETDLRVDYEKNTLTVLLHHQANQALDKSIQHLCSELNETETIFPGTTLRLIYKLGSS